MFCVKEKTTRLQKFLLNKKCFKKKESVKTLGDNMKSQKQNLTHRKTNANYFFNPEEKTKEFQKFYTK